MSRAALAALALLLAAGPAAAQGLPGGNSSEPVDIVADSLVVEQEKQIATFTGNVEAVQGGMTLTSDLLRVFYADSKESAQGTAAAAASPAETTSIKRIEAEGKVKIFNPTDTAEGDRGVYDVPAQTMQLTGNVVLTRAGNVIKGETLDMDLKTNVSTVRGSASASGKREQRVRALFAPEKKG
ncbi:MAG: lipopolysaccharide transport periplasmic protein LptA [Geminicoccaceae bacterium]